MSAADKKLVTYAQLAIDNADLRQRLSSMAIELVRTQDELERSERRLSDYDSDTLQLSKMLAADNAQLRGRLERIRQAHPSNQCADDECALCATLYPRPELVRS